MEELTLEKFAATILWQMQNPHEMSVRWLCASKEHKDERMIRLFKAFSAWRDDELQAARNRGLNRN